ncbi:MAG: DUF2283 domain-containing protein [Candidatus Methanofastidiosia archaeon]
MDYDSEADVLYINFTKPAHADESIMSDDDIIYRYEGGNLVGITILGVKKGWNISSKEGQDFMQKFQLCSLGLQKIY